MLWKEIEIKITNFSAKTANEALEEYQKHFNVNKTRFPYR